MTPLHHYFAHPEAFWLLPLLAVTGLAVLWSSWQRSRAVRLLGQSAAVHKLLRTSPAARRLSGLFQFLGLLLLLVGAAGPRWGLEFPRDIVKEHDVVIVLDVSRSMFAEQPTRLERALRALNDLADHMQDHGGQRLALVVFAARPHLVFPLTRDYDHFRIALEEIKAGDLPADIYPSGDDSPLSGTRIGAGLTLAAESFDAERLAPRAVLLLSDGDDPRLHDDEWLQGVHAARAARVVVHTVGIGDPNQESVIMIKAFKKSGRDNAQEGPLKFEGNNVKTKLEETVLRDIAASTGGVYIPAQTSNLPLGTLLPDILAKQPAEGADIPPSSVPIQQQQQAWFLWPALLLLTATLLFRERSKKFGYAKAAGDKLANGLSRVLVRSLLIIFAGAALCQLAAFTPEEDWIREGNAAFARGEFEIALNLYEKAEAGTNDPGLVAFNKAATLYQLKRYREAELHYLRCLEDRQAPPARQTQALFHLGNALLRQADDKNSATFDRAIDAFTACLCQRDLSPQLAADAQYNLEMARWGRFQAAPQAKPPENGDQPTPKHKQETKEKKKEPDKSGTQSKGSDENKSKDGSDPTGEQKTGKTFAEKLSSSGKLTSLPDTAAQTWQAPEDIAGHLDEAVRRIRDQRREQSERRPSAGPHVKDW